MGFVCVKESTWGALLSLKSLFQLCLMALGAFVFHLSEVGLTAAQAGLGGLMAQQVLFAWWWSKKRWCIAKDIK